MKKWIILVTLIIGFSLMNQSIWANSNIRIEDSQTSLGKVGIYFNTGTSKRIKLIIAKGNDKYSYNLQNLDTVVYFPLQMGDGSYSVKIYENTTGNKYRAIEGKSIQVKLSDPNSVYLQSVQEIDWNEQRKAIKISEQLIAQREKELGHKLSKDEIARVLYEYIIEKIVYDYNKVNNLPVTYLPNIDQTITSQKGICYDYSSLFASVLRNQGIPAKLVKGYSTYTEVYHAWNEVLIDGKWVIVDSTSDAYMHQNNAKYDFAKALKDYKKTKEL